MTRKDEKIWTRDEEYRLASLYSICDTKPLKWKKISDELGRSLNSCRGHWRLHSTRLKSLLEESNCDDPESDSDEHSVNSSRAEYSDDHIYILQASRRVMSQEELMEAYGIDQSKWQVEKYIIRTSEGYRKDRKVSWHVEDGVVVSGDVEDSGKMLVVPLYHMELRLIRKIDENNARNAIIDMIEDARKYSPKYPTINYCPRKSKLLYEIAMPDIHFGRLTWHEESGNDFDIKVAQDVVRRSIVQLLHYAKNYDIEKILLPIGNDYFNSNNKSGTTSKGTPQQEDTRWQKTFRAGRMLAIDMIDMCSSIAPTDVLFIPGNHDEERTFYMGDALDCWYHNNDNVHIDNSARSRKYYDFGNVLLGFTHGDKEAIKKLPNLMQFEVPKLWGNSVYREWHTGHKHHKLDYILEVDEQIGIVIRVLRSLVPEDAWTFNQGLIGSQRASEAFLWDGDNGLVAQFNVGVDLDKYKEGVG